VGSRIKGVVRNLTDFGAFVEIVPGVDGLVHISDMSWTRRINHPSEVVQKGEEVEAVITSVDVINQRISLSMKELLPNEWEEYANSHGVGDLVSGVVTNITDFGVFVELAPGVEGLCHISEIDRDGGLTLAETFMSGQKVTCRILRIDWNENRIGLSMHSVDQEESDEPVSPTDVPVVETAMAAALKAVGIVEEEPEAAETAEETVVEDAAGQPAEAVVESEVEDMVAEAVEEAVEEPVATEAEEAAEEAVEATVETEAEDAAEEAEEATVETEAEEAAEETPEATVETDAGEETVAGEETAADEETGEEAADDGEPADEEDAKKQ
jgi:predicted RNA-binding protein with RPS1 domain